MVRVARNRGDELRTAVLRAVLPCQRAGGRAALAITVEQQGIASVRTDAEQFACRQRPVIATHVLAHGINHPFGRRPPEVDDVVAFARLHDPARLVGQVDKGQRSLSVDYAQGCQILSIRRNFHLGVLRVLRQIGERHRRGANHAHKKQQQRRHPVSHAHRRIPPLRRAAPIAIAPVRTL